MDTTNGASSLAWMPSQPLPQTTTKEYKASTTTTTTTAMNNNKETIEAQLNELRKEFYQKDETIDDILRKRTTIVDRKVF
jgi:hypothetical protein